MNEGIILGMVRPYIKDSTLTYHEFEGIFDMLSLKEQYAVIEVLEKNQIELVDGNTESEVLDDILTSDDFFDESDDVAILYDDSLFSEKSAEKGLRSRKSLNAFWYFTASLRDDVTTIAFAIPPSSFMTTFRKCSTMTSTLCAIFVS